MAAPGNPTPDAPSAHHETWSAIFTRALKRANLTQSAFAELSGITNSNVSRWAGGDTAPQSADIVIAVAHLIAPDWTADLLSAAGFPRTAALVREGAPGEDDRVVQRIREERDRGRITEDDARTLEEGYRRRAAENAHLFQAEIADRIRTKRRARRGAHGDAEDERTAL